MLTSQYFSRTALAAALLLAATAPLAAQDNPRVVTGTVTLENAPEQRVQVILNRKARLGVVVLVDLSPATDSIGAVLTAVTPNGPAYRAGLRSGDIVTRFNGKPVAQITATVNARPEASSPGLRLIEMTAGMSPGDSGTVQYRRGAEMRQTTVVVSNEPAVLMPTTRLPIGRGELRRDTTYTLQMDSFFTMTPRPGTLPLERRDRTSWQQVWVTGSPLADVDMVPLNPELGRYFGIARGVLVINVPSESRLGLKPGDVVLAVNSREVRSPGHLVNILMSYSNDEEAVFQIVRMKQRLTVTGSVTGP